MRANQAIDHAMRLARRGQREVQKAFSTRHVLRQLNALMAAWEHYGAAQAFATVADSLDDRAVHAVKLREARNAIDALYNQITVRRAQVYGNL